MMLPLFAEPVGVRRRSCAGYLFIEYLLLRISKRQYWLSIYTLLLLRFPDIIRPVSFLMCTLTGRDRNSVHDNTTQQRDIHLDIAQWLDQWTFFNCSSLSLCLFAPKIYEAAYGDCLCLMIPLIYFSIIYILKISVTNHILYAWGWHFCFCCSTGRGGAGVCTCLQSIISVTY